MTTTTDVHEPVSGPSPFRFFRAGARDFVLAYPLLIGLGAMFAIFGSRSSSFFLWDNWRTIALQAAILGVVAVPQALLVICGHLDLSVGSVFGMTGVLAGYLMVSSGWHPLAASLVAIGLGAGVGLLNGIMVCYLRFSSIVVTLGMLTLVRGLTFFITAQTVSVFGDGFGQLGGGELIGIPVPVLIAGAVFLTGGMFLWRTPGGRHVYAIGVNPEAAYLSGIPIRRLPAILFVLSGAAAALGGLMMASRLDAAPASSLGVGFELSVLTAVLLGGVAFSGGRGSIFGVLLGVLFLGVLQNGLALLNVPFAWQLFASGLSLVVAAGLEAFSQYLSSTQRMSRSRDGGSLLQRISPFVRHRARMTSQAVSRPRLGGDEG